MHKLTVCVLALALALTVTISQAEENTEQPEVVEESVVASNSTKVEGSSGATCSCDNTESPVCASNGVTYKNQCRFECSKKRVKRLRVVKRGKCQGVSLNEYRGTRPRQPQQNPSGQSLDSILSNFFRS